MGSAVFQQLAAAFPRWASSVAVAPNGCWVWARPLGWGGYATARIDGHHVMVHRAVYEQLVEPIPDDRPYLDHLCRVRHCVNPNHLEPVTALENVRRGDAPAVRSALAREETQCRNGHEYTPETTSIRRGRYRRCLICERATTRRYWERHRERISAERRERRGHRVNAIEFLDDEEIA